MHSITALCRLTGLNASTVRSWERRYGTPKPSRVENGRRAYSSEEVERLALVARLVRSGHAIGDLCRLPIGRLRELAPDAASPSLLVERGAEIVPALLRALEGRDFDAYREQAGRVLGLLPPVYAVERVLTPVLRHVGREWASGRLPTYVEHLTTAITKQLVFTAARAQPWPRSGGRILFTTLDGELHEMGALLAWYAASSCGYNAMYMGPNLPIPDLLAAVRELSPSLVVLSMVNEVGPATLRERIGGLSPVAGQGVDLWVGAGGGHPVHAVAGQAGIQTFDTVEAFVEALKLRSAR